MDLFPKGTRAGRLSTWSASSPTSDRDEEGARRPRPRSGRLWRGAKLVLGAPASAFPLGQIVRSGRLISGLASDLRAGPRPTHTVLQQRDGKLDLAATAFVHGLSDAELRRLVFVRRRQTARLAYLAFGMGWVFVGVWLWRVLDLEGTGQRIVTGVQFAPFCLIFFLTAFKQAHVNWQLRTGKVGSAGDYLRSPEPFWPRG